MRRIDNDRWSGIVELTEIGRQRYTIEAWRDAIGSWAAGLAKRQAAGLPVEDELPDGRLLLEAALGYPDAGWGMVKLPRAEQKRYLKEFPGVFVAAKGAWGAAGCTHVHLKSVDGAMLKRVILAAWRNTAPKRLVEELGPKDTG